MNVKDSIVIEGLELPARVGHTQAERRFPQIVTLDIEIFLPLAQATREDRMGATLDYAGLIKKIERLLTKKTFVLIETLAEAVADLALEHRLTTGVSVKATKKVFAHVRAVGAHVWRAK